MYKLFQKKEEEENDPRFKLDLLFEFLLTDKIRMDGRSRISFSCEPFLAQEFIRRKGGLEPV